MEIEIPTMEIEVNPLTAVSNGGTMNYDKLENKPTINGVTLEGNKTTEDLHIETPNIRPATSEEIASLFVEEHIHTPETIWTEGDDTYCHYKEVVCSGCGEVLEPKHGDQEHTWVDFGEQEGPYQPTRCTSCGAESERFVFE